MRNTKGFSLTELLVVLAVIALLIMLIVPSLIDNIYKAQGTAQIAKARMVFTSAEATVLQSFTWQEHVTDKDYIMGLTGVVDDTAYPIATRISKRMVELNAPDLTFSKEYGTGIATVEFVVKDSRIQSMTYKTIEFGKLFTVTLQRGGAQAEVVYTKLP